MSSDAKKDLKRATLTVVWPAQAPSAFQAGPFLWPPAAGTQAGTQRPVVTLSSRTTLRVSLSTLRASTTVRIIARPPAGRLIAALRRTLTRGAFDKMVAPFIAQEQNEYFEALSRNEKWYARFIVVRMWILITYNVLAAFAASMLALFRRAD
jgi:hypothetical protein